ncbi:hypothetical protein VE00_05310 [Pseudogymnoascus sp. WSF 3629]|nr:hypothetical protein VE00_05310 [Pseudogymnoascus sp. WSF 3629]
MSAPAITRIRPTSGPTTGGITVVITGTNLASPSAVTFDGISATINSSSATSISVTAPAHAPGVARVVVTTAAGSSTQAVNFNYVTVPAPVITSISPTNGSTSGGNTVTISGTNLLYTTGVTFGTTPASSFAILSNNQVAAVAPAGAAGVTTVSVTNGTGTSNTLPYTYNGIAAPVVSTVSPTSGPATGGNTVVINGSGFTHATAVTFGSTPATSFTVASDTAINAVVPPGPSAGGDVSVFVTGPGGTSATGPTYTYTPAPTPIITQVTPASGPVSGGNTVVVTGSNFDGATAVTFGGNAASSFTVISPTRINAVAPPGTAGTASVVVTTPAGASPGFNYTYLASPAPTAVFPTTGVTAGGDSVAITGTGLTGTTSVNFGTTPATSFTVVSDTEIDAITPAHLTGTVPINITTPGGTNSSLSFNFQPAPVISSITPTSGPTTGGTVVTITGADLIDTIGVNFGTTPATTFTVDSDNTVTATAPAGAVGPSAVTVDTASATSNGATFTYVAAPTLTSLSPTGGPVVGGNNVTLTGTGFTTATDVFFGANPAAFTILDDTLISAVAPSGFGAVSVTVTNPGGTSNSQTYTYS